MSFILEILSFTIYTLFAILVYKIYKAHHELNMAYARYLSAYKLKVLEAELKARNVTLAELEDYTLKYRGVVWANYFGKKNKKKHTLDEVEAEVKGDLEDEPEKKGKKEVKQ